MAPSGAEFGRVSCREEETGGARASDSDARKVYIRRHTNTLTLRQSNRWRTAY